MAEASLDILVKLIDNASEDFKKFNQEAIKQVDELKGKNNEAAKDKKKNDDEAEKGNQKQLNSLQKVSKSIRQVRSSLLVVSIALGAASLAVNTFARTNDEARNSLQELGLLLTNVASKAGELISRFTILGAIGRGAKLLNSVAGDDDLNNIIRAENEIKNFSQDIKDLNTLYETGRITSSDYYRQIIEFENSLIGVQRNKQVLLNQLATAQSLLGNKERLEFQTRTQEQIDLTNFALENHRNAMFSMESATLAVSQSIQTNLTGSLTSLITGAQTAKEAFADLGKALVQTIVEYMVQRLVAWALEKTLLAGTVASSVAAYAAITAAAAPAALAANIASFGGAALAAAKTFPIAAGALAGILAGAGASGSSGLGGGGSGIGAVELDPIVITGAKKKHSGGMIRAHDGLFVDEVPIIAQTGEGVLSRRGMQALGGEGNLNKLNSGGAVSGGSIVVNVYYPKMTSKDEVRTLAEVLGQEIERKGRYARG